MGLLDLDQDRMGLLAIASALSPRSRVPQGLLQAVMQQKQMAAEAEDRKLKQQMYGVQLQEAQMRASDMDAQRSFRANLPMLGQDSPQSQLMHQAARSGALPVTEYLKAMQPKGLEFGKIDPKDYTPESLRLAQATGDYTKLQPVRKLDVVNNQAVDLYGAQPGQVFDMVDPNKPFNLQGGKPVANTAFQQYEIGKARAGAASTTVNVDNLGLKPKDRFEMEGKLSDDFLKATAGDRNILTSVSRIKTALGQDGALKDQAAIYAFAKALDPEGAVRESDYAAIANSAGLIDRVRHSADRLLKGEKLSPAQRQEMLTLAGAWEKVAASRIDPQRSRFSSQAKRYNLNPEAVLDPNASSSGWSIKEVK